MPRERSKAVSKNNWQLFSFYPYQIWQIIFSLRLSSRLVYVDRVRYCSVERTTLQLMFHKESTQKDY